MLLVPGGTFTMGAASGGEEDERPARPVTVQTFFLDATEVTNIAYAACVNAKVCGPHDRENAKKNGFDSDVGFRGAKQPASALRWDDARAYCAWIGKRLPTEAEWERAARGDDGRTYPWGEAAPDKDRAVFGGGELPAEVGTRTAGDGPYGHHDLAGNVWEWVEDVYDPYAYRRASTEGSTCESSLAAFAELRAKGIKGFTGSNPIPTECERVLRGGAFNYRGPGLRATNRAHHPPRFRLVVAGFRCAKDA